MPLENNANEDADFTKFIFRTGTFLLSWLLAHKQGRNKWKGLEGIIPPAHTHCERPRQRL